MARTKKMGEIKKEKERQIQGHRKTKTDFWSPWESPEEHTVRKMHFAQN